MSKAPTAKTGWKQRVAHELLNYWIAFLYLAFFFATFAWYRRFILAEYHISYYHYGTALIEALILAKVVLIGDALRLGGGHENKPLIFPVLYKAVMFSLFVGLFAVLEHTVGGLVHGKGLAGGFHEIMNEGKDELLARCLLTFFSFIPFFAFRELARVIGEGKLSTLFFRHR